MGDFTQKWSRSAWLFTKLPLYCSISIIESKKKKKTWKFRIHTHWNLVLIYIYIYFCLRFTGPYCNSYVLFCLNLKPSHWCTCASYNRNEWSSIKWMKIKKKKTIVSPSLFKMWHQVMCCEKQTSYYLFRGRMMDIQIGEVGVSLRVFTQSLHAHREPNQ